MPQPTSEIMQIIHGLTDRNPIMSGTSVEDIRRFFDYIPETGDLVWRHRPDRAKDWNTKNAGKVAGSWHKSGSKKYVRVVVNGKRYYAHRIAYAHYHGEWPEVIDHIDGDGTNNAISNMRAVTQADNQKNHKIHRDNKSGVSGVWYNPDKGCFIARIGKQHVGCYQSMLDACAARFGAEKRLGYISGDRR